MGGEALVKRGHTAEVEVPQAGVAGEGAREGRRPLPTDAVACDMRRYVSAI